MHRRRRGVPGRPGAGAGRTDGKLRTHMPQTSSIELVAILRGLTPERAPEVGAALVSAGFRTIEVPLNSPDPFATIKLLASAHGADCLVGAGTVLNTADVDRVRDAGGGLIVAPNCDPDVIRR